jgi:hypothetical protein
MAVAPRFDVALDGRGYLVDYTGFRRRTLPAMREQRDTSTDVGENTLSNAGQWVRSQTDWSLGAGQAHYDLADSDRRRFDSSKNIDVFTKGQISLCKAIEQKHTGTNSNLYARVVNGSVFYFSDGQYLRFGSPDAASPSFSSSDQGAAVTDWTSDGTSTFAVTGAAVKKVAVSSTSAASTVGSFAGDVIEFANGRLLSADGARIVELDTSGTVLTFDKTLTGTCKVIKGGPNAIYAGYNDNGQGILYGITVSTSDGALSYPVPAAVLPVGETFTGPFCIDVFGEIMAVGTTAGVRFGVINASDQFSVTFGPVIDDGGAAYGVRIVGQYCYWGAKNGDTWKADLTTFTDTLVPAYARFLAHDSASYGNVLSLEVYSSKLFFTDSLGEVYGEDATGDLATSGELTVGKVSYGTVAKKIVRGVSGRFGNPTSSGDVDYQASSTDYGQTGLNYQGTAEGIPGTTQITLTDDSSTATALTLPAEAAEQAYAPSTNDSSSEVFTVKVTLTRDGTDTTTGPTLERWSMFARPQPQRIEELIVPIVLQGRVQTSLGGGAPVGYDTQNEFVALRTLLTAAKAVTYEEGERSESVTVEDLEMQPIRYADDHSWWEGTLICRLVTVP